MKAKYQSEEIVAKEAEIGENNQWRRRNHRNENKRKSISKENK